MTICQINNIVSSPIPVRLPRTSSPDSVAKVKKT
jgi:hypothetical protein